jgi:flagellar hook-basal body complex protein FliE
MNNIISGINVFPPVQSPASTGIGSASGAAGEGGFGAVLKQAIDHVEQLNANAQTDVAQLLEGSRSDVHNVMVAVEKADVAFQLMMQVRNKIVSAYQEVSRMQF